MRNQDTFMVIIYCILLAAFLLIMFGAGADPIGQLEIERQVRESALRNGIEPNLALAIVEVESQFNVNAVGLKGELGLFQLRPEFHSLSKTVADIDVATRYLARLKIRCAHYADAFFVCFNYGPNKQLVSPRSTSYYLKVKAAQLKRRELVNGIASRD